MLLPIAVIALVFLHIVQVRMKGVVPPIGNDVKPGVTLDLRKK
jgi:quinol-cytochrome oxidoreductase complex cytochrome b subunit